MKKFTIKLILAGMLCGAVAPLKAGLANTLFTVSGMAVAAGLGFKAIQYCGKAINTSLFRKPRIVNAWKKYDQEMQDMIKQLQGNFPGRAGYTKDVSHIKPEWVTGLQHWLSQLKEKKSSILTLNQECLLFEALAVNQNFLQGDTATGEHINLFYEKVEKLLTSLNGNTHPQNVPECMDKYRNYWAASAMLYGVGAAATYGFVRLFQPN